ncbi:hypothetical protein BC835DRAFT_1410489 [Cytidiella melzeri]|nr:hypothetical protein BC835DRAFT_1410489 [Cytidiella melzeri]
MSSPIAVPHTSVTSSTSSKYVPLHKRQGSGVSPTSSRSPSPVQSETSSWRSHSPTKASPSPQAKKFPTKAFANHHHRDHEFPRTHIPQQSPIPTSRNLPFVYSISDLLSLSSSPVTLSPAQLRNFEEVVELLASPINNDKTAVRRRRHGRRNSQAAKKVVAAAVDVEVRRTRHGHGTWGWQPHHALETTIEPWRHVPITAAA